MRTLGQARFYLTGRMEPLAERNHADTGRLWLEDGKQYTFRVQGVDRVGNAGAWLETTTATTYAVTKYYPMAGHRVAQQRDGITDYFLTDALGSVRQLTFTGGL